MKIPLILIGFLVLLSCSSRNSKKDLLKGHWTYFKTIDLRTEEEKSNDFKISAGGLHDKYPDLILLKNGILERKHKNGLVENGIWEIENDSLKLSIEVEFENVKKVMDNPVIKPNIRFKLNGRNYIYAGDYPLKRVEKNIMELGNQMFFDSYKKVK